MSKDLLETHRKSILKILEEHSNSNLSSQAAREQIAQEILLSAHRESYILESKE